MSSRHTCIVETCDDEAVGKCTVDNGATTDRKPACEEHEGERFTTPGAVERSNHERAEQRQMEHYDWDYPKGGNPRN